MQYWAFKFIFMAFCCPLCTLLDVFVTIHCFFDSLISLWSVLYLNCSFPWRQIWGSTKYWFCCNFAGVCAAFYFITQGKQGSQLAAAGGTWFSEAGSTLSCIFGETAEFPFLSMLWLWNSYRGYWSQEIIDCICITCIWAPVCHSKNDGSQGLNTSVFGEKHL